VSRVTVAIGDIKLSKNHVLCELSTKIFFTGDGIIPVVDIPTSGIDKKGFKKWIELAVKKDKEVVFMVQAEDWYIGLGKALMNKVGTKKGETFGGADMPLFDLIVLIMQCEDREALAKELKELGYRFPSFMACKVLLGNMERLNSRNKVVIQYISKQLFKIQ